MRALDTRLLRLVPVGSVATGLLSVARAGLAVAQAVLLAQVLARGFRGEPTSLVGVGVVLVLRGLAAAAQEGLSRRTSAAGKQSLRHQLLHRVAELGPAWLTRQRSGELATLVGPGADALDAFFAQYLPQLALAAVVPVAVLVTLFVADWPSAVVVAVTLPLLPVFLALVGRYTRQQTATQWRQLAQLGGHVLDVVQGLPTLRVFGRAKAQVLVLQRLSDEHRSATVRALRSAFLSAFVLELVATLSVAVLAVSVGFRLLAGDVSFDTALLVLLLAPEAYLPLRALGTSFHAAQEGVIAAGSAFDVMAEPVADLTRGRRVPLTTSLSLHGVSVIRDGRTALDGLDLEVAEHECVALEGMSGAGKSTVLALMLGLVVPTHGRVLVGGVDLREVDREWWRSQVGWVPQHPHLFARSVADNIRLGLPGATDGQVRRAARAAGAEQFVEELPHGFDTVLGEGGTGLSVGQQRRLAVARAFLRDAPLLLLDEPTAGLDAESEGELARSLERLCQGRTVVLATHHRNLVTPGYRVITLSDRVLA